MSVPVSIEQLAEQLEGFDTCPHLVTVGDGGAAHAVSVRARLDGSRLVATAGRTTRGNAATNPRVTLLWAAPPGAPFSLIVDGDAAVDDDAETVTVDPVRAVLHRVADAPDDLPSCIRLEDPTTPSS